ncbi:MAG: hypothetical protein IPJ77_17755 [Planctomycetes bacterium]|nr:hypothetical protein [Planctomycetota bacterium]
MPRDAREHATLRAELQRTAARRESAARQRSDRALAFRARVLAAQLARQDGLDARRVRDPGIVLDFLPGEARLAAEVTLPGPLRTEAVVHTLDEAASSELPERFELAREVLQDDLAGLRLEPAEAIARAWLRRDETVESGVLCARVLRANGRLAEAADLLARLERDERTAEERAALALERARDARARGDQETALDALGTALASGSSEAGLLLARERLERGETAEALALARPFLDDARANVGARRVWALALLAPERETARLAPGEPRGP